MYDQCTRHSSPILSGNIFLRNKYRHAYTYTNQYIHSDIYFGTETELELKLKSWGSPLQPIHFNMYHVTSPTCQLLGDLFTPLAVVICLQYLLFLHYSLVYLSAGLNLALTC